MYLPIAKLGKQSQLGLHFSMENTGFEAVDFGFWVHQATEQQKRLQQQPEQHVCGLEGPYSTD